MYSPSCYLLLSWLPSIAPWAAGIRTVGTRPLLKSPKATAPAINSIQCNSRILYNFVFWFLLGHVTFFCWEWSIAPWAAGVRTVGSMKMSGKWLPKKTLVLVDTEWYLVNSKNSLVSFICKKKEKRNHICTFSGEYSLDLFYTKLPTKQYWWGLNWCPGWGEMTQKPKAALPLSITRMILHYDGSETSALFVAWLAVEGKITRQCACR